ncbi:MAG TPA: hypothetical protein VFT02_16545 [Pyrinomonadaceae bacterium]|nr:hypothetical protein [Pyrinomonadaceae bacterium]
MKRCPQCEFIYEDDQSLCDMDGALLVLDSRTLPSLHALATVDVPVPVTSRSAWRQRTFPAVAALILATVLSLVYFVTTQRGVQSAAPSTGVSLTAPITNPPQAGPAPEPPPATEMSEAVPTATEDPKPEPTKAPTSAATKKTSAKPSTTTTQNKTTEPKKEDSKVNSILKKTGRILKKPFKF